MAHAIDVEVQRLVEQLLPQYHNRFECAHVQVGKTRAAVTDELGTSLRRHDRIVLNPRLLTQARGWPAPWCSH